MAIGIWGAAGALAAALSTAAGLLLVISSSFSHDLVKSVFRPDLSERSELRLALHEKLREKGIVIPFPQRDVHIQPPA